MTENSEENARTTNLASADENIVRTPVPGSSAVWRGAWLGPEPDSSQFGEGAGSPARRARGPGAPASARESVGIEPPMSEVVAAGVVVRIGVVARRRHGRRVEQLAGHRRHLDRMVAVMLPPGSQGAEVERHRSVLVCPRAGARALARRAVDEDGARRERIRDRDRRGRSGAGVEDHHRVGRSGPGYRIWRPRFVIDSPRYAPGIGVIVGVVTTTVGVGVAVPGVGVGVCGASGVGVRCA